MLVHNGQYYREENLNEGKHCSDGTASGHFICLPRSLDAAACPLLHLPSSGITVDGHLSDGIGNGKNASAHRGATGGKVR